MKVQSMKKLMACLTVVASVVTATAQGTFTANNNYVPNGATDKAFIIDVNGEPAKPEVTRVEILYNDVLLKGYNGNTVFASVSKLTSDGLFSFDNIKVPNTNPGDTIQVVVRAWDITFCSYDISSFENAGLRDSTIVTIKNLGGGTIPTATFAFNSDFRGLDFRNGAIPEPSTYVLMALGLIGVFFINKRK